MGSSEIKTLNELFLKAVASIDKPDCFLVKSEGAYQGISSQEALRKVAALASLFSGMHVERARALSSKIAWSGR